MSYALLWIELLAAALLWQATLTAWMAGSRRWWRRVVAVLAMILPLALLGSLTAATAELKFDVGLEHSWFGYATSLLAAFLIGVAAINWAARRKEAGAGAAAAGWPAGRLAVAFLLTVAVLCMTVWNMDNAARTQQAFASLEAGAIAQSLAPPMVPDGQNAAILYEKAFARLPVEKADLNALGTERGEPEYARSVEVAERFAATAELLREAAARPTCRFEHDYVHPDLAGMLPELGKFRAAARLLAADANNQVDHGRIELAMEDVRAMYRIGRHASASPFLVSGLVTISINYLADMTLTGVLPAVKSGNQLVGLELDPSLARRIHWRTLRGEEAFVLAEMSDMGGLLRGPGEDSPASGDQTQGGPTPDGGTPVPVRVEERPFVYWQTMPYRLFFAADDRNAYRRLMAEAQGAALQPYYRIRSRLLQMERSRGGPLTAQLAPVLAAGFDTVARAQARDTAAVIAVAMTRYRLDHGGLPDKLDGLVPKYLDVVPLDPFDGQPMRLASKGDDRLIYSVGPDGKDDGGAELDRQTNKGDVVLKLGPVR